MFVTFASATAYACNVKHTNRRDCIGPVFRASPIVDLALGVALTVIGGLAAGGILPLPQGIFFGIGITTTVIAGLTVAFMILDKFGKMDNIKIKIKSFGPSLLSGLLS